MQEWFDLRQLETSYKQMGRKKASHMIFFEDTIIKKMDKYFSPLFPGFRALKQAVFPNTESFSESPIDHDTMIVVLNTMLQDLPKEYTVATQRKRGTKRACAGQFVSFFTRLSAYKLIRSLICLIFTSLWPKEVVSPQSLMPMDLYSVMLFL